MKKISFSLCLCLLLLLSQNSAQAQLMRTNAETKTSAGSNTVKAEAQAENKKPVSLSKQDMPTDDMTEEERKEVEKRLKEKLNPRIKDGNLVINPIDMGKTTDGSQRGNVGFFRIDDNDDDTGGEIFLYYSNFKIIRSKLNAARCQVRFNVLNGLNSKISNLSVKLVWPELSTPVSFSNVSPNTEVYYDYVLFGEGCYQMDKLPNIVVNRCRVKGLSQENCAQRIRWLNKSGK